MSKIQMRQSFTFYCAVYLTIFTIFVLITSVSVYIYFLPLSQAENVPERHTYSPKDIDVVCQTFELSHPFCSDLNLQDYNGFVTALEHKFPIKEATYFNFIDHTGKLLARPSDNCKRAMIDEYAVYATNNCPPPSQCTGDYSCTFILPDTIGALDVRFQNPTGQILIFRATRFGIDSD